MYVTSFSNHRVELKTIIKKTKGISCVLKILLRLGCTLISTLVINKYRSLFKSEVLRCFRNLRNVT